MITPIIIFIVMFMVIVIVRTIVITIMIDLDLFMAMVGSIFIDFVTIIIMDKIIRQLKNVLK